MTPVRPSDLEKLAHSLAGEMVAAAGPRPAIQAVCSMLRANLDANIGVRDAREAIHVAVSWLEGILATAPAAGDLR